MINKRFQARWPDSRVIKFIGTGVLNTAFGYGVYSALLYLGIPYLLALLTSTISGVAFNYLSFGRLVFNQHTGWLVFGRFVAAYAFIYLINSILLGQLIKHLLVSPYIGQIICIPISVAISWLTMNYWVFKKEG